MKRFFLKKVLLCSLSILSLSLHAQDKDITVDEYISTYKDIAIQEMERSGIPASITLAQGIHESAFGNSRLAKKAKNHFGIKCTSDWDGSKYHQWDDDPQKSCFRVYQSALNSYIDHTNFLLNRKHYSFLFKYDRKDYRSWAKGLKKAGYATDPNYPNKLIHTIEKYGLAKYDRATGAIVFDPKTNPEVDDIPLFDGDDGFRKKPRSFFFKAYGAGFYKQNGSTYAIAKKGESALAFAKRFGIPYKRLLRFNDLKDGDQLIQFQYLYIQPKKSTYRKSEAFHKVKLDETMYEIAQYYGVKLKPLLKRNLLKEGEEPRNGELILLKDRAVNKPKLRGRNHLDTLPAIHINTDSKNKTNNKVSISNTKPSKVVVPKVERPKPQEIDVNKPTYNEVVYADTVKLNTAVSNDSSYLNMTVTANGSSSTNSNNNPFASNNDGFQPVTSSNSTNTSVNNNTTDNNSSNSIDNNPNINPNALFGGGSNSAHSSTNTARPYSVNNTSSNNNNTTTSVVNYNTNSNPTTTVNNTATTERWHVVQRGETLYALYRLYKVKVEVIKAANNLTTNTIKEGQRLKIPVK